MLNVIETIGADFFDAACGIEVGQDADFDILHHGDNRVCARTPAIEDIVAMTRPIWKIVGRRSPPFSVSLPVSADDHVRIWGGGGGGGGGGGSGRAGYDVIVAFSPSIGGG